MTAVFRVCQDAADNAALRRLRPHPLSINQSKDSHRNKRLATENKNNHSKAHFLGENWTFTEKKSSNTRKKSWSYIPTQSSNIYILYILQKKTYFNVQRKELQVII